MNVIPGENTNTPSIQNNNKYDESRSRRNKKGADQNTAGIFTVSFKE